MTHSHFYIKKLLFLVAAFSICFNPHLFAAKSISQFGITWTFDRDYQTGQFANGDYWVVGPVRIRSISPASITRGGVTMHGSMINPSVNSAQGYDSRIKRNSYSAAVNVADSLPLVLSPGTSLLSSESHVEKAVRDKPQLKTIAILTVLDKPAPAGSFRPPPVGTNKALRWNKSQLNYSKLRSLARVPGTPPLSQVEAYFERPWIEQGTTWVSRYIHPGDNQPTYGREIAHTLAQGLLSLQLDYKKKEKETLLIRLVQYGIDIYGSAREGAVWPAGGGHNHGRKMPLLLAGTVLGDQNILDCADGKKMIFQEDRQTWYVAASDVGRLLYAADGRPRLSYLPTDVGMAEWGEKHFPDPKWDGRNWNSFYRTVAGASTVGHILTARLMGLESAWNWPAAFDYYDRYWSKEHHKAGGGSNTISSFVASMWKAYRNADPSKFTDDNVATEVWQNTALAAQTGSFTLAFDLVPSAGNIDGLTGLSSGAADANSDIAAGVRFASSGFIDAPTGATYKTANALRYVAGVKYRVVMSVNVATKRYSVSVTPAGGSRVVIADNWAFRTQPTAPSALSNFGFSSAGGYHAVLHLSLQPSASTPPVTSPAATGGTTKVALNKTSSNSWQNVALPSVTGKATFAFDLVAQSAPLDVVTGITSGPAKGYGDFAIAIRLGQNGLFHALNGTTWSKATNVRYVAGRVYRVSIHIDVPAQRYSATVTPEGGQPVTIANNWKFRSSAEEVEQLNNLTLYANDGAHTVSRATLRIL